MDDKEEEELVHKEERTRTAGRSIKVVRKRIIH